MKPTLLFVIEGIDGAGKSTQIDLLQERLETHQAPVVIREPGGTDLGLKLRRIMKSSDVPICPISELFMMSASRSQLVKEVIKPLFEKGDAIIIADRYFHSTIAYQGYGRGLSLNLCWSAVQASIQGCTSTRIFWIDVPIELAAKRIAERGGQDRFEGDMDFLSRVAAGYKQLWQEGGLIRIDGTQTIAEMNEQIWATIQTHL